MLSWLGLHGLGLCLALQSAWAAEIPNYTIRFERSEYVSRPGETYEAKVLIEPVPPVGTFSFGVRTKADPTKAQVVGASTVQVFPGLAHDGPLPHGPIVVVEPGSAGAKGTAEFLTASRPNSSSSLLVSFLVRDLGNAPYSLELTFFNTLGPTEQIFVDGQGNVLDQHLTFVRSSVIRPQPVGNLSLIVDPQITLNRQSGLFEQVVRVQNNSATEIKGVRLQVAVLPSTWVLWNAQGAVDGQPYVDSPLALTAGGIRAFRLEYRIPDRKSTIQPAYQASVLGAIPEVPVPAGTSFAVEPRAILPDGSFLLEFNSLRNRSYTIQWSDDFTIWKTAAPNVVGNGSRLQWIDNGPPKTDSAPAQSPKRYYRIFLLP